MPMSFRTLLSLGRHALRVAGPSRAATGADDPQAAESLRRAEEAPAIATRSLNQIKDFVALLDELRGEVATSTPAELIEAILVKNR